MSDHVRIAVAGAGAFGREHIGALSGLAGVKLVGIADVRGDAAKKAADEHRVADWSDDPVSLIDTLRPDGVVIATPGVTHVPLATAALERGIPVLVEKPVAVNRAEAMTLAEAEARSSGFVLPGHILRFSDAHRIFRDIVRSEAIGPIVSLSARRHRDDSHAARYADDPVLMTMIHDIDLAVWITGSRAVDVLASRKPEGSRSETLMTARDAAGATWRLSTAWTFPLSSCPPDRIEVIGERGSVEMEDGGPIRVYGIEPRELPAPANDLLAAELEYFRDCILERRRPSVVTLAEAIIGLAAADAALASLKSGGLVRA